VNVLEIVRTIRTKVYKYRPDVRETFNMSPRGWGHISEIACYIGPRTLFDAALHIHSEHKSLK